MAHSKEGFSSLTFASQYPEAPLNSWIDIYFNSMHIMAQTFSHPETRPAFQCFYQSLSDILPSSEMKEIMQDFILMKHHVQNALLSEPTCLKPFFLVHKEMETILKQNPENFFDYCCRNRELLFLWTYLCHNYYNILYHLPCLNLNNLRNQYQVKNINKETWSHPIWFILHFSALNSPNMLNEIWTTAYKAFAACLQIILPCELCRQHWVENLPRIPIDNYLFTCDSLFQWSWLIHNEVNKKLDKPSMNLDEARMKYTAKGRGNMSKKSYYELLPVRYA